MRPTCIVALSLICGGCFHRTIGDATLTDRAEGLTGEEWSIPEPSTPACERLPFAGGTGTRVDPYRICSAAQLAAIGRDPYHLSAAYRVTADLDLESEPSLQIGSDSQPFTGHFDGGGHVLRNFVQVTSTATGGLFASVDQGTVEDVHLVDVYVESAGSAGALVGRLSDGTVSRCSAIGLASTGHGVVAPGGGGLVAGAYTNTPYAEPIARIYGSFALVDVSGEGRLGGLVGNTSNADVRWSFAGGEVNGTGAQIGGLIGYCWSNPGVSASFASGDVTGGTGVGGLIGYANGFCDTRDAYATGAVTGNDQVGGAIGFRNTLPNAVRVYATGVVNGASSNAGALIGYAGNPGEGVAACFFASDVNPGLPALGNGSNAEARSVTSDSLRQEATFTTRGWDFDGTWTLDPAANDGFPIFQWQLE